MHNHPGHGVLYKIQGSGISKWDLLGFTLGLKVTLGASPLLDSNILAPIGKFMLVPLLIIGKWDIKQNKIFTVYHKDLLNLL